MNTPVVVNEEEFEVAVEMLENEDGWLIGSDGIVDPDGNIAILVSDDDNASNSEKGQGMLEWMALSGVVAFIVLLFFNLFGPAFIAAFNTYITDVLP